MSSSTFRCTTIEAQFIFVLVASRMRTYLEGAKPMPADPFVIAFVGKAVGFIVILFILAFIGLAALLKKVL
jgi:hypothetical protein